METNERERGVTFSELWRAIKKRLWAVLLVAVLIAAAVIAAFVFAINPANTEYKLTFTISYPGSDTFKYPDGTPFYYQDIISIDALWAAKETDPAFSGINVDKMLEEDDISVSEATATGTEEKRPTSQYTIEVRASYFKNRSVATRFLRAVASGPVSIAKEKAGQLDYLLDKEIFSGAAYGDRLELLAGQKTTLIEQYDKWIALYRENYTVSGKTLKNYRAEVAVVYSEETSRTLADELESNGYVSEKFLEMRIAELQNEKVVNEQKIAALKRELAEIPSLAANTEEVKTDTPAMDLSEMIASLIVRNVQIDSEIAALTPENVAAFEARIDREYESLERAANTIKSVATALYEQESRVGFDTTSAAESGGMSLALVVICGVIVGLFVSCFVVCLIEVPRGKREEAAQRTETSSEEK